MRLAQHVRLIHANPQYSKRLAALAEVFELLLQRGLHIAVMNAVPEEEVLSINTPAQLAEVDGILRSRGRTPLESTP